MRLRRGGLDAHARDRVGIRPGERVISWGVGDTADPDGSLIVATDAALYEQRSRRRIEWQRVTKGTWEQPEFVIDFDDDGVARRFRFRVDDARDIPAAVRDRVTDTVVVSEYRTLEGDRGAFFVARRSPDGDVGDIRWSVVFDEGLNPGSAVLRERADAELKQIRASLGI
ncbi:MAG: hypothetical protein GY871_06035 [Actinomycetales bacterium]|nr:hypothetical protein [Actinomycetales bacterium]MCP4892573.1 hypothetical protein [Actinomycetales bacterium]